MTLTPLASPHSRRKEKGSELLIPLNEEGKGFRISDPIQQGGKRVQNFWPHSTGKEKGSEFLTPFNGEEKGFRTSDPFQRGRKRVQNFWHHSTGKEKGSEFLTPFNGEEKGFRISDAIQQGTKGVLNFWPHSAEKEKGSEFLPSDKWEELSLIVPVQKLVQNFWSLCLFGEPWSKPTCSFLGNPRNCNFNPCNCHYSKEWHKFSALFVIGHFRKYHNTLCLSPQICIFSWYGTRSLSPFSQRSPLYPFTQLQE